ncbi:MAG: histidine kinase [Pseudoclavibacter sp.]|nr:histidine kinase [Pseudoclavibacter sp.]
MTRSSSAGSASRAHAPAPFLGSRVVAWLRGGGRHMSSARWLADIGVSLGVGVLLGWPMVINGNGRVYFMPELIPSGILFLVAVAIRRWRPSAAFVLALLGVAVKFLLVMEPHGQDVAVLLVIMACAAYGGRSVQLASLASCMMLPLALILFFLLHEPRSMGWHFFYIGPGVNNPAILALVMSLFVFFPLCVLCFGFWFAGFTRRLQADARDSRHRRQLAELESERNQEQLIVEQERNRIARDMHDVVAHSLAVVVAQANGGRYAMRVDPRAGEETLVTISDTAREALSEVRGLLAQLRHNQSEGPQRGFADLPAVIERMRHAGLHISVEGSGEPRRLGPNADIALFRLVQESLTNALRHGDRRHPVVISVHWDARLTVSIENVVSPTPPPPRQGSGHGLIGMRERIIMAGGTVETGRMEGRFVVRATVPTLDGLVAAGEDGPREPFQDAERVPGRGAGPQRL